MWAGICMLSQNATFKLCYLNRIGYGPLIHQTRKIVDKPTPSLQPVAKQRQLTTRPSKENFLIWLGYILPRVDGFFINKTKVIWTENGEVFAAFLKLF